MNAWKTGAICILLAFLCLFSAVGYATISDTMQIIGSARVEIPYGLFITNIKVKSTSNVDNHAYEFKPYTTTVDSTISRTNSGAGTVTYEITVLNNTKLTYSYRDIYFQTNLTGYTGNAHVTNTAINSYSSKIAVVCSLKNTTANKKVEPGESLVFTVVYTIGTGRSHRDDWKTLINFQFGINVDGEREALEVVEQKFLNILNSSATYTQLIDALDNKFDGRQEWTSNYIGNVNGSSSEDSVAVNTLFAGHLQISVGKDDLDATVMIKHENLDGNVRTGDDYVATNKNNGGVFRGYGCEMTLYLTVDPLNRAGAYVPVYAVVFTCDRDANGNKISEWYRIGSTYAGTANVVTYDGGNGTGSFVTDNWRADAETYRLIDGYSFTLDGDVYRLNGYSYSVASGETIKSIVSKKDPAAVAALQTLLNDAKRLIDNHRYAGVGIDLIIETYAKYAPYYTVDANGNHTVNTDLTLAQISPAIINLYRDVNAALTKIEELQAQQQG